MKATELRIGNFVTIDNEEFHPEIKNVPLEVTQILQCESLIKGIWTHSVSLEFINKKKNVYYEDFGQFIKYIEPIQLTEEWLLKFGFDKSIKMSYSTGVEVTFNVYEKSILTYNSIQNCWWINDLILYMQPEYVHELQNLYFALTGEELTLNEKL